MKELTIKLPGKLVQLLWEAALASGITLDEQIEKTLHESPWYRDWSREETKNENE